MASANSSISSDSYIPPTNSQKYPPLSHSHTHLIITFTPIIYPNIQYSGISFSANYNYFISLKIAKFSELMVAEEVKQVEPEVCSDAPPPAEAEEVVAPKDVAEEKAVIPPPADESKALVLVEKPEVAEEKNPEGSIDRDVVLARVATEKRLSLIKAWEESEKSKAENKAQKKISAIGAWENTKKANFEAELKSIEEQFEKKKAGYMEKMKNKAALIHKSAEEKRAMVEARRGEELLKAEEVAAKYRATETAPKKLLGCF